MKIDPTYVPALIAGCGVVAGVLITALANRWMESVKARAARELDELKARAARELDELRIHAARVLEETKAGYLVALEEHKASLVSEAAKFTLRRTAYLNFFSAVMRLDAYDIFNPSTRPNATGPEVVAVFDALLAIEIIAPAGVHERLKGLAGVVTEELAMQRTGQEHSERRRQAREAALRVVREDLGIVMVEPAQSRPRRRRQPKR